MIIVNQSWEFLEDYLPRTLLLVIEDAGRTCYKSNENKTKNSEFAFVSNIIRNGHHSVLEHGVVSAKIITDRGVTHELVRHRIASYSQESTRYCNYSKDKFGNQLTFIKPVWCNKIRTGEYPVVWDGLYGNCTKSDYLFVYPDTPKDEKAEAIWFWNMAVCERDYMKLLENEWPAQYARDVLPNSLKTEIVVTMNLREWRHFFSLRTSIKAHPQMRQLALDMLKGFAEEVPIIFDDIAEQIDEQK